MRFAALDFCLLSESTTEPAEARPVATTPAASVVCPPVPLGSPPVTLELDPRYTRYADVMGLPLVAFDTVDERAFRVAAHVMKQMLAGRPDLVAPMREVQVRVGIIPRDLGTTAMPEHADLYAVFPETDWDVRTRGVAATVDRPLVSVGEENLLSLPQDRYWDEKVLPHELGHTLFELGLERTTDGPRWRKRLDEAFSHALSEGLVDGTFAATNPNEYWAEGVQSWFDVNAEYDPPNGLHGPINTRDELRGHDPTLSSLLAEVFGDEPPSINCLLPTEEPSSEELGGTAR